jgi:hypothetical protein
MYCSGCKIKKVVMGRETTSDSDWRNPYRTLAENLLKGDHLED